MKFLLSVLSILVINFSFLNAGDWPSWRGTARDDVSTEKGLLKKLAIRRTQERMDEQ